MTVRFPPGRHLGQSQAENGVAVLVPWVSGRDISAQLPEGGGDQKRGGNEEDIPPRSCESPFERMYARGQIDPDFFINGVLHGAGTRYYTDWYLSGMNPISAMSYDRVGGGGTDTWAGGMPASEMQAHRRQSFRAAREHLGDRYVSVVDPIVLEERHIRDIREDAGYVDKNVASAIVRERLNVGLRRLAVHYGIMRA